MADICRIQTKKRNCFSENVDKLLFLYNILHFNLTSEICMAWQCTGLVYSVYRSGIPNVEVWYVQCTGLVYPVYMSGIPSAKVWYTQCSGLEYPVYGSGIPSVQVWYTQYIGLVHTVYGSCIPSVQVWYTKCTGLVYPVYRSGMYLARPGLFQAESVSARNLRYRKINVSVAEAMYQTSSTSYT